MSRNLEDVYQLSPLQEGMLFHSLYAPESGVYVEQMSVVLGGTLDVDAFRRAWRKVVELHPVLRTGFTWKKVEKPLQVVHRKVELPFVEEDWREVPAGERDRRLGEFLRADRRRGFDLARPPLCRWTLLRLDERSYQVVWSFHHLILDGWSVPLVIQEVLTCYRAGLAGEAPKLAPRPPFRNYVRWLRTRDMAEAERFWRRTLAGFTAPTEVLLAAGRVTGTAGESDTGEQVLPLANVLPPARAAELSARKLTLNTVVQGAWGMLLGRYTGRDEAIFGSTVSGRPGDLPGADTMVGMFINTLPVRLRLPPRAGAGEWLRELQAAQAEQRRFEYTPLVQIQSWSDLPAGEPLFESILVFENQPVDEALREARAGDLELEAASLREQTNYPLSLVAVPGADFRVRLLYDRRRYLDSEIARMLRHLRSLLDGLLALPESSLGELPLLTMAERQQLVAEWNDNASAFPREQTVPELFAVRAERSPAAVAVVDGDRHLSYGELGRRARRLAGRLRDRGAGRGVAMAIYLERSPAMIEAMLAVLHAGGAYVPLEVGSPEARLGLLLEDTGAPLILTDAGLSRDLAELATPRLRIDEPRGEETLPAAVPAAASPSDLAYVIYTSGSTGRPKGVAVSHRALVRLVRDTDYVRLGPEDRVAQASNSAFDAATFEIWGPLLAGGTVTILDRQVTLAPERLAAALRDGRVSTLFLTTALFNTVARESPGAFGSLRQVLFGGEAVDPRWPREVLAQDPPERLLHVYGPTECTTFATWHAVRSVAQNARTVAIGRGIANTRVHVLDRWLTPVPAGVEGELYLGGEGLARGYLDRPALTAERFLPDPCGTSPGERLYATGDVVRWSACGEIEFVGRVDDQVKIRGFRIEPGEIEAALAGHPAVRRAVVLVCPPDRDDEPGERRLAAFAEIAGAGPETATDELQRFLAERLPAYMVPRSILTLGELPLNVNGKIDRAELLRLADVASEPRSRPAAWPRSPVEEVLAGIFAGVLGVERVGTDDDFFELGGHSLLATRVVSRIRKVFDAELPLEALFEAPTVAGLAARLEGATRAAEHEAPPLERTRDSGDAPLSFAQQRLWYLDQLEPGSPLYNITLPMRLAGALRPALLRRAFEALVERHEVLRTTFEAVDGRPRQRVASHLELTLPLVDLGRLAAPARAAELRRRLAFLAARPYDLATGPLLRLALFRLAAEEHGLLLSMHHVVGDGWSMGVLLREVAAFYRAARDGRDPGLAPLPIQYGDYARWQRRWLSGPVLESHLEYWRGELGSSPDVLELPTDRPRPAVRTSRGARLAGRLEGELRDRLEELSRKRGGTLFMTLLAAFQALLGRLTGAGAIHVGTPVAGRNRAEIEVLIGVFINTLVIRAELGDDPAFDVLADRVRTKALAAYAHQDLPFDKLVDELEPARDPAYSPLFQVMFGFQNFAWENVELPDLSLRPMVAENPTAKFDLTLEMAEDAHGLAAALEYNVDLFDATTARRLLEHFGHLLRGIAADPGTRVSALGLLSPAERHHALTEWNDNTAAFPRQRVDEICAGFAERRPDAVAVDFDGEVLSYGALAGAAQRLTETLRRSGIAREVPVALYLERAPAMVVAMLATLRAGGVYVPLDVGSPAERLRLLLEDAGAPVVVTTADLAGDLAGLPARLIRLDPVCRDPVCRDPVCRGPAEPAAGKTDDLAYVIFTSGSTGRPKGVAVSHRAIVRLVRGTDYVRLGSGERVAQASNSAFDAATFEIWGPLLNGGTIVGLHRDVTLSPERLAVELPARRVDALFLTTALFNAVVRERPGAFASLRWVLFGGEAVDPRWPRRVKAGDGPERLLHVYGPTECTTFATWHAVGRVPEGARTVAIGRGLANTRVLVLDRRLRPVPIGVQGELLLGGAGLARSYFGRPRLTAERFVPDPLAGALGTRLYATGDVVRWSAAGTIEFVGRVDDQVKVRGFRIEPGEIEAVLASHPAVREAAVIAVEPGEAGPAARDRSRQLVSWVVGEDGAPEAGELRAFLRERLPEYMVPAHLLTVGDLPLNPNGKVDRGALVRTLPSALASVAVEKAAGGAVPGTPEEELLAGLWRDLLGLERVGVHDNFFELGGDSILSIQLVSRAREAGLELSARQVFEHQTIAEQAAVASSSRGEAADQGPVTGDQPMTPIQHWFFELGLERPHHWNQALLLDLRRPCRPALLARAVGELVRHHDALRLRFTPEAGGGWRAWGAGLDDGPVPFGHVDLSRLAGDRRALALERACAAAQASLDLAAGPLLRVLWLDLGGGEARLLWVIHHLAVDGVSWRILLEDLETAYTRLEDGSAVQLPAKTHSLGQWAEAARQLARAPESEAARAAELAGWLGPAEPVRLPRDHPEGRNSEASARTVAGALDEEETRALLSEVPAVYRTRIQDVLLTALAEALAGWTGRRAATVALEGHGRGEILEHLDLSRTVGWFTAMYPVDLDLGDARRPGDALRAVKERLRAIPAGGAGYGLLRAWGAGEAADRLRSRPRPEISFNYLGQLDRVLGEASTFLPASESPGPEHAPGGRRPHLLDVGASVAGGRLRAQIHYSEAIHERATVERLLGAFLDALRGLIAHCLSPGAGGYSPSDFPLSGLGQEELDALLGNDREIEDVYPLTPLQEGMLNHRVLVPGSDLYFEHLALPFLGELDPEAFERSWQTVVDRHPALRTSFAWDGLERPLQIVHRRVQVPFELHDWRGRSEQDAAAGLAEAIAERRRENFDPARAPLFRFELYRFGERDWRFLCCFHHILLDGWSASLILGQFLSAYGALTAYGAACRGSVPALAPAPAFRAYVEWLLGRDRARAGEAWRRHLAGFRRATDLRVGRAGGEERFAELDFRIPADGTEALQERVRRRQLTLNTLVQGAWAVLLSRYGGELDVLFGATTSGRPDDLPASGAIVGAFINTVPVRVAVEEERAVFDWLAGLQASQAEMRQHDYLPRVQEWSEVPLDAPLFETLLVFENYPGLTSSADEDGGDRPAGGLKLGRLRSQIRTRYPLTLVVQPGRELYFQVVYDAGRFEVGTVERLLGHLRCLVETMAGDADLRVGELDLLSAVDREQLASTPPDGGERLRVVDDAQRLLPIGVPGTLLAGDRLAGDRSAGDLLAVAREDGRVERLGPRRPPLTIHGVDVPPFAIEWILRSLPAVADAHVILEAGGKAAENGSEAELVAFLAFTDGLEASAGELRRLLRRRRPGDPEIDAFVVVDRLERGPDGEVREQSLPAPGSARRELERDVAGAGNPYEEILAGIWSDVLGVERADRDQEFFESGGHSLLATQLMSRVNRAFDVELPLKTLFEAPTLAALARRVERAKAEAEGRAAPPLERLPRGGELPLSFAQERLWFMAQLDPASPAYNVPMALRIDGDLDVATLAATVGEILRRHEVLRSVYASRAGRPVQVVADPAPFHLPVVDLGSLADEAPSGERPSDEGQTGELERLARRDSLAPFDLERGPLLRMSLVQRGAGRWVALLNLHHIVSDAWSLGVLVQELGAIYAAFLAGQASPLPELPVQYADFAHWQRRRLRAGDLERQLRYWKRRLAGELPVLRLPTDRPASATASFHGCSEALNLPAAATRGLISLGRREGATLFMTLLAAFQTFLYRETGQDDLVVGTAMAGRDRLELEDLIGFFINMVPMRADLSGRPTFREVLRQVKAGALEVYSNQDLPFDQLVKELEVERDGRTSLFRVTFGVLNVPSASLELPELELSPLPRGEETTRFDLAIWMWNTPRGVAGSWTYRRELFEAATIRRLQEHFKTLVSQAVERPDVAVDELEILSPEERSARARKGRERARSSHRRLLSVKPKSVAVLTAGGSEAGDSKAGDGPDSPGDSRKGVER